MKHLIKNRLIYDFYFKLEVQRIIRGNYEEEENINYIESYDPHITLKYPKINLSPTADTSNLLGKRVELNDKIARIKYVGPLKHKKEIKENEIWLG